ncbi:MAG TPA: PD-(D/E)XK nuclease family protein [Bryobacteraceae bacterium]|nr:PD-(D/E)XK nuclease family protein [Bryobacteraceae bacterium]
MNRTIIDVLKKGSLELFHSDMLRWLMDETEEHRHKRAFLNLLATTLSTKGFPNLSDALKASPTYTAITEFLHRQERTDIEIQFPNHQPFVIENKTKSLGTIEQLDRYAAYGTQPIALGFTAALFPTQTTYPVLDYHDILAALNQLVPANDRWGTLISEYRDFLTRELNILDHITHRATHDNAPSTPVIQKEEQLNYRDNDKRVLQYYYLAGFRQHLTSNGIPETNWELGKHEISGVWIATKIPLALTPTFSNLTTRHSATLCLQLELHNALFSTDDKPAGEFQLRTTSGNAAALATDCRTHLPQTTGQWFPCTRAGRTNKLFGAPLYETDLAYDRLEDRLRAFAQPFCAL